MAALLLLKAARGSPYAARERALRLEPGAAARSRAARASRAAGAVLRAVPPAVMPCLPRSLYRTSPSLGLGKTAYGSSEGSGALCSAPLGLEAEGYNASVSLH